MGENLSIDNQANEQNGYSFKTQNIVMAIVIGVVLFGCVLLGELFPYNAPITFYTDSGAEGGMPGMVFGIGGGLLYGLYRSTKPYKGLGKGKKFIGFAFPGAAVVGGLYLLTFGLFVVVNFGGLFTPDPCEIDTWDDIYCPGEEERGFFDF
ncbi:MAG: hypothetical protein JKY54_04865 [Flavobacteriales bacterium]|nr:hypothetical protein [Flavobacteriales bacterium]